MTLFSDTKLANDKTYRKLLLKLLQRPVRRFFIGRSMKLSILRKIKLSFEILTSKKDEKGISIFQEGYKAGLNDGNYEKDYTDRQFSRLASIIECHWDDKDWVLKKLGIAEQDMHLYLTENHNHLFDTEKLGAYLDAIEWLKKRNRDTAGIE